MVSEPVELQKLSVEDFRKFLSTFDHVFSDCDGVIWTRKPLPQVGKFFSLMGQLGKTVHFVSNNSIRRREDYEEMFKHSDIENGYEKLTHPAIAIAEYLKSMNFDKQIYCVTCQETMHTLQSNGFKCKYGPDISKEYYQDFVEYLEDDLDIGAVVFDSDFKINLPKLYKAITYLKRPEVLFINGASDRHVPMKNGLSLGVGCFGDIAAEEVKREPVLLGKPGKMFGEFAMRRAAVKDPSRVLFIGDMIEQDIGLGKAVGFKTLLVLTSNNRETMLVHEDLLPDYCADSLGDLVPQLSKAIGNNISDIV